MASMRLTTNAPAPKALCASEHAKLISGTDGLFPDFGHHSEGEMGGLWMHPIKVLDGFWLRFRDEEADKYARLAKVRFDRGDVIQVI